ncbi:glycosyltransferase family 2 protein [Candidatus Margulisiibacteriota bacterium]
MKDLSMTGKELPLVTVVTAVFNAEKYLEETIKSVINQSYKNIEYIIIDGGSTDGTLDIIKKYDQVIDYWLSEPDNGEYDALNKGIEVSSGSIITSLNSDDTYYSKDTIDQVVNEFLNNKKLYWVHGDFDVLDDDNKITYPYKVPRYNWRLLLYADYCYVLEATSFFKKEIYSRIGKYDYSFRYTADYDFFLRIGDGFKNMKLNFPIVKYRFHSDRLSQSHLLEAKEEARKIKGKYSLSKNRTLKAIYLAYFRIKLSVLNIGGHYLRLRNIFNKMEMKT